MKVGEVNQRNNEGKPHFWTVEDTEVAAPVAAEATELNAEVTRRPTVEAPSSALAKRLSVWPVLLPVE